MTTSKGGKEYSVKYNKNEYDLINYNAPILEEYFDTLLSVIENRESKKKNCLLILTTHGGSPHIAYKIARLLKNIYGKFYIIILSSCKSAGTIVAIGADTIIFDRNRGALGPIDVQILKRDEDPLKEERQSGLDLFQGLTAFREEASRGFIQFLGDVITNTPVLNFLSPKNIVEISSSLASSLFSPISSKLDVTQLGKYYRAIFIAKRYSKMLEPVNIDDKSIDRLINLYPDHNFVIDYIESKHLFKKVHHLEEVFTASEISAILEKYDTEKIKIVDTEKQEKKEGEKNGN